MLPIGPEGLTLGDPRKAEGPDGEGFKCKNHREVFYECRVENKIESQADYAQNHCPSADSINSVPLHFLCRHALVSLKVVFLSWKEQQCNDRQANEEDDRKYEVTLDAEYRRYCWVSHMYAQGVWMLSRHWAESNADATDGGHFGQYSLPVCISLVCEQEDAQDTQHDNQHVSGAAVIIVADRGFD